MRSDPIVATVEPHNREGEPTMTTGGRLSSDVLGMASWSKQKVSPGATSFLQAKQRLWQAPVNGDVNLKHCRTGLEHLVSKATIVSEALCR